MPDTFSSRNILDFYYLEAMVDRAKRLPEVVLPSQEVWRSDLTAEYEPFVKGFAASIRDYLFLACMGEARHATQMAEVYFPELGKAPSRERAYKRAVAFSPVKSNGKLAALFNECNWYEPGYGGTKWGAVASALNLYGDVPDAVFIDLVVAIEQNNGNVFSKPDAADVIAFQCDMAVYECLGNFLGYKARLDILSHPNYLRWLSRETLTLLARYYRVVSRKDAPREIQVLLARRPSRLPKEYESPWGDEVLGEPQPSPREEGCEETYDDYVAAVSVSTKVPRG